MRKMQKHLVTGHFLTFLQQKKKIKKKETSSIGSFYKTQKHFYNVLHPFVYYMDRKSRRTPQYECPAYVKFFKLFFLSFFTKYIFKNTHTPPSAQISYFPHFMQELCRFCSLKISQQPLISLITDFFLALRIKFLPFKKIICLSVHICRIHTQQSKHRQKSHHFFILQTRVRKQYLCSFDTVYFYFLLYLTASSKPCFFFF